MIKYLAPLGVFCFGMLVTLVLFLFLGTIETSVDQLATDTADIAPVFWNWSWIAQGEVVKFIIVVLAILLTLYGTAMAFLKVKR